MHIEGSGAIVVGGASGLGEATARALAERGASVVVADVNDEKGQALAEEIGASFAHADVTKPEEVEAAVAQAAQADGGLRISVHCAGVGWAERVASKRGPHQLEFFEKVIAINLIGTFNAMRLSGASMIGNDPDGDGVGQPVLEHAVPDVGAIRDLNVPQSSDELDGPSNLAWQWQANPRAGWSSHARRGWLRLNAEPLRHGAANLWPAPNLLLQKLPAPSFDATTRLQLGAGDSATAGLIVFGMDYAYVALRRTTNGVEVVMARATGAASGAAEQIVARTPIATGRVELRVTVHDDARCRFSWSADGAHFTPIGDPFPAREGKWVGAKVGIFAERSAGSRAAHADFDWFRITPPIR